MLKTVNIIILLILSLLVSSCAQSEQVEKRSFTVLAINDVYRIDPLHDGEIGGFARFKTLRDQLAQDDPGLITLHGGDFLSPSILGQRYEGEQIVDIMNQINGDAETFDERFFVVPGNHEFDKAGDEGVNWFRKRVGESNFWWITSNINWHDSTHPEIIDGFEHVITHKIIEANGVKVGIFGLTLNRDKTKYAPIDENYVAIAKTMSQTLRDNGAEVVIGLTHLALDSDVDILNILGEQGPDIIFGGHEHDAMAIKANERWLLKADSDLISANVAVISLENGEISVAFENIEINQNTAEDPVLKTSVDNWLNRYYSDECGAPSGEVCKTVSYGHTNVELDFDNGKSRLFETNLGNWLADTMKYAFANSAHAQIAFINSGAIRRNENIAAGSSITEALVNELLPYDPKLYLIEITGRELKDIVRHSASNWGGNGYWLQISGFAFRVTGDETSAVMIMEGDKLRPVEDDEVIRAVTVGYLLNTEGPQDGYKMLNQSHVVETRHNGVKLHEFIREFLLEQGEHGISPTVEGRICTNHRQQPCLLDNN